MRHRAVLCTMTLLLAVASAAATDTAMPSIESASLQTVEVSGSLAQTLRRLSDRQKGPLWAGYSVPAVEGERTICCGDWSNGFKGDACCGVCRLEKQRGTSVNIIDGKDRILLEAPATVVILYRMEDGAVDRVRAVSPNCRLDAGSRPFYWLTGVDSSASIAWLSFLTGQRGGRDEGDHDDTGETIMAISLHAGAEADTALEKLAQKGHTREEREQATFWMGNARGRRGYETLRRMLKEEDDSEIKEKVIFALSQSPVPEATDALIDTARHDDDSDIRGEAIFWLAQQAAERAEGVITEAIEKDPETEVKKKAVFALSQLPTERGVPLLIDVARTNRNPAIRKEAIFWLGQSGDPRALDFLEEILETTSRKGV